MSQGKYSAIQGKYSAIQGELDADCQQQNLMRLDKAWKCWLVPDKASRRGGKPRFKKQGDICSFTFPRVNGAKAGAHLSGNHVKLSKIGELFPLLDAIVLIQHRFIVYSSLLAAPN
jgi:transposase